MATVQVTITVPVDKLDELQKLLKKLAADGGVVTPTFGGGGGP